MQLASFGFDIRKVDLLDNPSAESIDEGIQLLQRIGALDSEGSITQLGREIQEFPMDPELAVALVKSKEFKVFNEMIVIAAILSEDIQLRYSPTSLEIKNKIENNPDVIRNELNRRWKELAKQKGKDTNSDFVAVINFYRQYRMLKNKQKNKEASELCNAYCVPEGNLKFLRNKINDILEALDIDINNREEILNTRDFESDDLTKAYITAFPERIAIRSQGLNYSCSFTKESVNATNTTAVGSDLIAYSHLQKKHRASYFAKLAVPVATEWLEELLPQNIKTSMIPELVYNQAKDKFQQLYKKYYNGIEYNSVKIDVELSSFSPGELARIILFSSQEVPPSIKRVREKLSRKLTSVKSLLGRNKMPINTSISESSILEGVITEELKGVTSLSEIEHLSLDFDNEIFYPLVQPRYSSFKEFEEDIKSKYPDFITFHDQMIPVTYKVDNYLLYGRFTIPDEMLPFITAEDLILPGMDKITLDGRNYFDPSLLSEELAKKREELIVQEKKAKRDHLIRLLEGAKKPVNLNEEQFLEKYKPTNIQLTTDQFGSIETDPKTGLRLRSYVHVRNLKVISPWEKRWKVQGTLLERENMHNQMLRNMSSNLTEDKQKNIQTMNTELRDQIEMKMKLLEEKHGNGTKLTSSILKKLGLDSIDWKSNGKSVYSNLESFVSTDNKASILEQAKAYSYMLASIEDALSSDIQSEGEENTDRE